jgi:uncharacterized UBP type Zn finger protein
MPKNYFQVFKRKQIPEPSGPESDCEHLDALTDLPEPATHECATCVADGDSWVHLRMCLACGNVACCDSSPNRHATAHFETTGHPGMRGVEPGERWVYCYEDQVTGQR